MALNYESVGREPGTGGRTKNLQRPRVDPKSEASGFPCASHSISFHDKRSVWHRSDAPARCTWSGEVSSPRPCPHLTFFQAAVLLHDDSSGDCRVFTQQLTSLARDRYGVKVHYGVEAVRLSSDETRILAVEAADGRRFEADLFVVCTGPHVELLETANVHLPIYPVKVRFPQKPATTFSSPLLRGSHSTCRSNIPRQQRSPATRSFMRRERNM